MACPVLGRAAPAPRSQAEPGNEDKGELQSGFGPPYLISPASYFCQNSAGWYGL